MNLCASLIVKNELGRYLKPCIEHLLAFCDSVVVVDDASTDGTFEWLERIANREEGVNLLQLPASEGFFDGHEGRRRQFLLDYTLEQRPDWVLAIDADEFVSDGEQLRAFAKRMAPHRRSGMLVMEEVWKATPERLSIRVDGGWRPHPVPALWRATGYEPGTLLIADRALACGREPEIVRRWGARARPTGVSILHFGWAREEGRKARYDRYVVADGGRFHKNAHLDSIMWPDMDVTLQERKHPNALEPWREEIVAGAA